MCLLIIGYRNHPYYPLIVAANREEAYNRPTKAADWWDDAPGVLAGRDLEAGGTWMGITRKGRFAALTNYWEDDGSNYRPGSSNPPSRGTLVSEFLTAELTPEEYLDALRQRGGDFQGFNLIFGNSRELFYYSNRSSWSGRLAAGIHVLSNRLLNTPWPKSERARRFFSRKALREKPDIHELLAMMNNVSAPEEQREQHTSMDRRRKLARQSIRIVFPRFGTRCSTVMVRDEQGGVTYAEQTYDPDGRREYHFSILG